ncbi:MAG: helix-turn-helix domain-containing protein [Ruminococcaceae bacterium]|nr:helix-turn-helix domain-containing protein [Oscillospiraceae bacterium]
MCSSIVTSNQKQSAKLETFFKDNCIAMDNKILSVFQVTNLLSENREVENFAKTPFETYRGTDYYNLLNLSDLISRYTVSYMDLSCRISLFREGDNLIFSAKDTQKLDFYLNTRQYDAQALNEAVAYSKTCPFDSMTLLGSNADTPFVTILSWHQYSSGDRVYYLIEFDKNYFFPTSGVNHGEFFAVTDETTGNVCLNQSSSEITDTKLLNDIKEIESPELNNVNLDNKLFSKKSVPIHNMVYVYHNPNLYSFLSYVLIMVLLLLLWLLLLVLGFYLSRYLAKRLYRPVNNVFGILGDVYHQEHDDDMTFLSDSVADLVTNNKRLQELAEKNKIILKHNFIKDLVTGHVAREQVVFSAREYNLEYLSNRSQCIVCEYDNMAAQGAVMDYQKIQTLKNIFMSNAEEHLRVDVSCELVNMDRNRFVIITKAVDVQTLNKTLMGLVNEAEEQYNISLLMAVGKVVTNMADLDDSYMSALNLLEYKFAVGDKRIIRDEDLAELGNASYYYPVEIEKNLIYNVLEGNMEKCEDILTHIFTVNFIELSLDKANIKDFKFALTATIKRILKQTNKTAEEIFGKDVIIYLELNAAATVDEINKSIRDIITEIARYIQENSKNKKRVITENIVQYIDENYNQDISLRDVAEHFCLSEGHIGRLLKNDLNTSFKQRLNERRIEVAKTLLLGNENLSVGDVATKVGCNSAMTFIRMFKKHTGISPGEYKKSQN